MPPVYAARASLATHGPPADTPLSQSLEMGELQAQFRAKEPHLQPSAAEAQLPPPVRRSAQRRRYSATVSDATALPKVHDAAARREAIPLSTVDLRHNYQDSNALAPPPAPWAASDRQQYTTPDDSRRGSVRSTASAATSTGNYGSATPTRHEPYGMERKRLRPDSSASATSSESPADGTGPNSLLLFVPGADEDNDGRQLRSFLA